MTDKGSIQLAVDAVVFGCAEGRLSVLLVKRRFGTLKGSWALPGGFVLPDEGLATAVARELKEETGVVARHLEQLYTFGDQLDRDPRRRVVSVAYLALVDPTGMEPQADTDAADARWWTIDEQPTLAFDHDSILAMALGRVRSKLSYQPIGFDLLPPRFTFPELEQLYSTILGTTLDRRNFHKKFMALELLKDTGKTRQLQAGRPARIYRFDQRRYEALLKAGKHLDLGLS